MEPEDEELLFEVAASEPRWKVAYLCSIATATTTARPQISLPALQRYRDRRASRCAIRDALIRDGLKNGHRERLVPLNETSRWAVGQILKRYFKLCKRIKVDPEAEHYVLPGRARRGPYDFKRPIGSWKHAWQSLRKAAGMPSLRMYDLRHHAITKLMEDPEISEPDNRGDGRTCAKFADEKALFAYQDEAQKATPQPSWSCQLPDR